MLFLSFDDEFISQYTEAFPYMQAAGMKGTMYCLTSHIGDAGYCSAVQLQEMGEAGWTIGHHFRDHLVPGADIFTVDDIAQQINWAMDDLDAAGLGRDKRYNATPGGVATDNCDTAMAQTGQLLSRAGPTADFYPYGFQRYRVPCYKFLSPTVTLNDAKSWIDGAVLNKRITSIGVHALVESPTTPNEWGITDFQSLIDYIASQQISVITAADLWSLYNTY